MTLAEQLAAFVEKRAGQLNQWDKVWGAQCTDLVRLWVDWLGIPQSRLVSGAADFWTTYLPEYYERIPYTLDFLPKPGDIMIWKRSSKYSAGHIAINLTVDPIKRIMQCLSQNDPSMTATVVRDYPLDSTLLGALRPRVEDPEISTEWQAFEEATTALKVEVERVLDHFIEELRRLISK